MRTSTRFRLGYLALAAVDTWLSGAGPRLERARVVTKPLLMPTLAASLTTDERARRSPLLGTTLAAQAFGWGGDVGLLGEGPRSFMLGAGSFGIGHLAYIAGFRRVRRERPLLVSPSARAVLAGGVALGPVVGVAAGRHERALGVAVPGYTAVLTTMAAHSGNLHPGQPRLARRLTFLGGLTFLASDSILGARKFLVGDPPAWMERAVMATYTTGQLLLAEGAARAR